MNETNIPTGGSGPRQPVGPRQEGSPAETGGLNAATEQAQPRPTGTPAAERARINTAAADALTDEVRAVDAVGAGGSDFGMRDLASEGPGALPLPTGEEGAPMRVPPAAEAARSPEENPAQTARPATESALSEPEAGGRDVPAGAGAGETTQAPVGSADSAADTNGADDQDAVARGDMGGTRDQVQAATNVPTAGEAPQPSKLDQSDAVTDATPATPPAGGRAEGGDGASGGAPASPDVAGPTPPLLPEQPSQIPQQPQERVEKYKSELLDGNDEWKALDEKAKNGPLTPDEIKRKQELESDAAKRSKRKVWGEDIAEQHKKKWLNENEEWKRLDAKAQSGQLTPEEEARKAQLEAEAEKQGNRIARHAVRVEDQRDALLAAAPDENDIDTKRWQELEARIQNGEKLTPQEQAEYQALDAEKRRKAEELAQDALLKSTDAADVEAVKNMKPEEAVKVMVQAAGAHHKEGNPIINWGKNVMRKYEKWTDGKKVAEKYGEYRRLHEYYKHIRHDEKFQDEAGKKQLAEFKSMIDGLHGEARMLLVRKFVLKDWPLFSLAMLFALVAIQIWALNKLTGGK